MEREKSFINIDSFWWNKNFKRRVCTVTGYFNGNIGKLIKTHCHNFRKVQTRQLKQLTVAPWRHLFPHHQQWDVKPRVTTWQIDMATPLDIVEMVSSAAPSVEGYWGAAVRLAIAKFCCRTSKELRSCGDAREPSQYLRHQLLECKRAAKRKSLIFHSTHISPVIHVAHASYLL